MNIQMNNDEIQKYLKRVKKTDIFTIFVLISVLVSIVFLGAVIATTIKHFPPDYTAQVEAVK